MVTELSIRCILHKFLNMQDNEDTTEESHERDRFVIYMYNMYIESREGVRELQPPPLFLFREK